MHKRSSLSLALIGLALTGCAALTPGLHDNQAGASTLPTLTPSSSAVQVPGLAIDRWWTLFGDPVLDSLVAQSLQHNHNLAAAAARVREARAQLDDARGAQLPSLQLQTQSSRARQSADGLPPGASLTNSRHQAQLAAQYEIDLWGRLAAGSDTARQRLLAQEWARAALQWSLTAQVAEAHFSLRAVQRQIEISEAVRDSRSRTLGLRRQEHGTGSASEFDLRRAEAELAVTDSTLAALQRQRVSIESALMLLSGRSPAEVAQPIAAAPLDTTRAFGAVLPQGDAAELLLRRPDLRQAEAQLAAARADIRTARAATLPAVRLTGAVGSDVRSLSDLFTGPGFVWSVASGLTQSLFDGGQLRARVEQADARADVALADYRQTVLTAVVELREAYAALDITLLAQRAEHERVTALERARRLAQLGFEAGAIGQLDLLDAERNAYQAQLDEVSATRDRLVSQVAAFKALGGGQPDSTQLATQP